MRVCLRRGGGGRQGVSRAEDPGLQDAGGSARPGYPGLPIPNLHVQREPRTHSCCWSGPGSKTPRQSQELLGSGGEPGEDAWRLEKAQPWPRGSGPPWLVPEYPKE